METEQYYTIYDFMLEDLNLKGNDLLMFALLYSFRCGMREIRVTYRYLAKRLKITERSAINVLSELENQGLLTKEVEKRGLFIELNEDKLGVKKFHPTGEKISPQDIKNRYNNNINIKEKENARARGKDYSLLSEEEKKERDREFEFNMKLIKNLKGENENERSRI